MKNKPYINYAHMFSRMLFELKEQMKEIDLEAYELHSEVDYFPPQITEEMLINRQLTFSGKIEIFRVNVEVRFVKQGKYSINCRIQDDGGEPYWTYEVIYSMNPDDGKCKWRADRPNMYDLRHVMFYESQWENLKVLIQSIP